MQSSVLTLEKILEIQGAYQEVLSSTEARHSVILWHKYTKRFHSTIFADCPKSDRSALQDPQYIKTSQKKKLI
jgi:hypothetical protein